MVFPVLGHVMDRPFTFELLSLMIALQGLLLGVSLLICLCSPRGSWVIDGRGIEVHPCHRSMRYLPWSCVERVRLGPRWILQGKGVTITIPWNMLPRVEAQRAEDHIKKLLANDFDFAPPRPPSETAFRLGRFLLLLGIGLGLTALWAAVLLALVVVYPDRREGGLMGGLWSLLLLGSLYTYAFWCQYQETRRIKALHPEWPWRVRRSRVETR